MGIFSRDIDECDKIEFDSYDGMFSRHASEGNGYEYLETKDGKDIYVKRELLKEIKDV